MRIIKPSHFSLVVFLILICISTAMAADIPKRSSDVQRITIAELQDLQTSDNTVIIVDTRSASQWQRAKDKIPGAVRVATNDELQEFKKKVPPDTEIVTYCT